MERQDPHQHKATTHAREHRRPEHEQEKYWVPSRQQWMSLNELVYEKQRATIRKEEEHQ